MVLLWGRALPEPGQTLRCSPPLHPRVLITRLHIPLSISSPLHTAVLASAVLNSALLTTVPRG